MIRVVIIATYAGSASVAGAQNFSLSLLPSTTSSPGSGSFTMAVIGNADVGTHMLGGAFELVSDSGCVESMTWSPASWSQFDTDNGYAGNGNYNTVVFGQIVIPNVPPFDVPGAGSELGGRIGTFTVTTRASSSGIMDFRLIEVSPFSLEVIDIDTGAVFNSSQGDLTLQGVTVLCIPSPSTIPVFASAGLLVGRRRRCRAR